MNAWHDIDDKRIQPWDFMAYIEISKNSKNKYELDKESGILRLDRVLYTSTHYPANYGFIPRTYADDGDALDVLVLCAESIVPGAIVECKPIGVLIMSDDKGVDEKIIAVPLNDPNYNVYNDVDDLPKHIFDEIIHFFTYYKTLEDKKVDVKDIENKAKALEVIDKSKKMYHEKFFK